MAGNGALDHTVVAFNLSAASENRIHDDTVAQRFGFQGGLVPGVEVYAYMTNLAVRHFGPAWLERGRAECRFQKPVYDGREATARATVGADGALDLTVISGEELCAAGRAALDAPEPAADPSGYVVAPVPDADARPDAAPETLPEGGVLGTFVQDMEPAAMAQYLADVREDLDLYARDGIVHPGWILRLANRALSANVRLGPWIHVGSTVRNHGIARWGDRLAARARVARQYERKGHLFVALDVLVVRQDGAALTHIDHTAIYRPRQVSEAAHSPRASA